MLIDCTYFADGPRHILNATSGTTNPNAFEVCSAIEAYIAKLQTPFLYGVLGKEVGKQALDYIKSIDAEDAERDVDLDMVLEQLKEPFADYVFFKILRDSSSQATMTGLVRLKSANNYVAPIKRQVSTWNEMVEAIADFRDWCDSDECPFPDIETSDNFKSKINSFNL